MLSPESVATEAYTFAQNQAVRSLTASKSTNDSHQRKLQFCKNQLIRSESHLS